MSDKKTRTTKPIYAIMSVTDGQGNQLQLTQENVTIHSTHKDANEVLDILDVGAMPAGTFYKRIAL
jgi:hypothetical protein|tara:strand:- start:573 stop:770 length:198 start_codon:yes stop_codon:yes gene_type:complete